MKKIFLFIAGALMTFQSVAPQAAADCSREMAPVVFVHGFLGSGDTWAPQVQRFIANGCCADRFFAFDWNSLGATGADALLDEFIDSVLAVTGAGKVHLVGHSAGGSRGYSYLSVPERAAKVVSYVHVGSGANASPAGPGGSVPTMNIWSAGDRIVPGRDIPGATNVRLEGADHYQVATSAETFENMYHFFTCKKPLVIEPVTAEVVKVGGRALTLGTNQPAAGVNIAIYRADLLGNPAGNEVAKTIVEADGSWGPVELAGNHSYIFFLTSDNPGFRKIIYYFEPFRNDNQLVYLRTFPPAASLAGLLLAALPSDDSLSVIAVFSSGQAVVNGRDNLTVNGIPLSTPVLADEKSTAISFFCYDDGRDGNGTGEPIRSFMAMPFLRGADIPVTTVRHETWTIEFNGRTIPVRNWSSKTDGVVIAVFK